MTPACSKMFMGYFLCAQYVRFESMLLLEVMVTFCSHVLVQT